MIPPMKNNRTLLAVRVSSELQDFQRQIDDLTVYAESRGLNIIGVISEKISGATKNEHRAGVQELLKRANSKEFDKLLISELSRLGRNAFEVQKIIEELSGLGISIVIQNLNMETLDTSGKRNSMVDLMLAIISQFSQMELRFLKERINSGIAKAQANGVHCGRKVGTKVPADAMKKKYSKVILDLKGGVSIRKVAKIHSISINTVQRVKALI
jgi:DNA invertase Pin-like site-specific DNA recombinase